MLPFYHSFQSFVDEMLEVCGNKILNEIKVNKVQGTPYIGLQVSALSNGREPKTC
jgi:hypothetical protein